MRLDELNKVSLARPKFGIPQATSKEFIPQTNAISIDHIGLAVGGDLSNPPLPVILLDIPAAQPVRLAGQSHYPAHFVESRLALGAERGQHVAEINGILGIAVEIGPHCETGRANTTNHRAVSQHGKIERRTVERHQLWR